MANFPDTIYAPRDIENKSGVVYDPTKKTVLYAEDVQKVNDEIVAIETELGANPKGNFSNLVSRLNSFRTFAPTLHDLVNVSGENNLIDFPVPANCMNVGDTIEVIMVLLTKNNSGASRTTTFRFYGFFDSYVTISSYSFPVQATEQTVMCRFYITRIGSQFVVKGPASGSSYYSTIDDALMALNSTNVQKSTIYADWDSDFTAHVAVVMATAHADYYIKPIACLIRKYGPAS